MQCVVRNTIFNVRQQIFVRRDSKGGRSVLPLNFKGAASVEMGKSADWSFLGFDLAITANAGQMASDNPNDTPSKQNDQDLSHVKQVFSGMMRRRLVLDSRKFKKGCLSRSARAAD
jgi:hypothetical protein